MTLRDDYVENIDYYHADDANAVAAQVNTLTAAIEGGNLDGVTIGATTPAVAVNAATVTQHITGGITLSGSTNQPWLNQSGQGGWYHGSLSADTAYFNYCQIGDYVNYTGSLGINGLFIEHTVATPAVGGRTAIFGKMYVPTAGTNTALQAGYIGVAGRSEIGGTLGGSGWDPPGGDDVPIGSVWGGWFYGCGSGGTYLSAIYGLELNVEVRSGVTTATKIGLNLIAADNDAVRGHTDDAAIAIAKAPTATTTWKNGIYFGLEQASINTPSQTQISWPFDTDSTLIKTQTPGQGTNPCGAGIDFSTVSFTDAALKTGAAPITMAAMDDAPDPPDEGEGKLYVASDGSLHYLGYSTDTQLAPA